MGQGQSQDIDVNKDLEIQNLRKEIDSLKDMNQQLLHRLNILPSLNASEGGSANVDVSVFSDESKKQINQFIEEKILSNSNINVAYLPDFVERQLYRNVMNVAIGAVEAVLSSVKINVLGHTITLNMNASQSEIENEEE